MTLEARTQALIDLVEADRRERVAEIVGQARARAAATRAQANSEALARVRGAFEEERARHRERLAAAAAQLQTHRRLGTQRRAAALLARAWTLLPEALAARWQRADARAAWVAHALACAGRVLPAGNWRVEHAAGWTDAERDEAAARAHADVGARIVFEPDPSVRAGLRVRAGQNVLDLTLEGLLADRDRIAAQLLHLIGGEW